MVKSAPHLVFDIEGPSPGPLLVLVGGIHGNEPAGVTAISEVLGYLQAHKATLRGRVVGVVGNPQALGQNVRYIRYDLNRCWTKEAWQQLMAKEEGEWIAEDFAFFELEKLFRGLSESYHKVKVCADLHTTSSENGNFIVIPEEEQLDPLISALHLPVVVDLAQYLRGTLLQYLVQHGFVSFAMEGGLLGTDAAQKLHIAGIWQLLMNMGIISEPLFLEANPHPNLLQTVTQELPNQVKVLYHHRVHPDEHFVMKPGYVNFASVTKGEWLANDHLGRVESPTDGLIFMPLYQPQGEDGFFIVEPLATLVT